ncbi:helix-turn-helix domain-containing protein [Neorhizobium sp. T786]|uniref:helix-turn-helix domain-containing protein n=1 Tax=Pseudorhizobium xiangyangii TaxID=2883104 RepID=UPI001CFF5DC5|nr:helix-turn-helix transcriptional regulator [Neorhizobium xiangyangii]MCB5205050.1 helix-turn-helix domain-containing protein [Neorhizobium xiangyangii]
MSYQDACNELRRIRKVRKIGVRQMAGELGISPATLSRIESYKPISLDVARKIGPWVGECLCCGEKLGVQP